MDFSSFYKNCNNDQLAKADNIEKPISVLIYLTKGNIMNELYNTIALRHKQSIVIDESRGTTSAVHIRGLLLDISQLGYTLNGEVINRLRGLGEVEFKKVHSMLITNLKEMVGANVKYHALFKNFPTDIPDDDEYFIKRFVGYVTNMFGIVPDDIESLSCGHVIDTKLFNLDEFGACPICQHQVNELDDDETNRPELEDITPMKVIGLISEDDVKQLFTNLLASKSSISKEDRVLIELMLGEDPSLFGNVPANITQREILAIVAGAAVQYSGHTYKQLAGLVLTSNIKTATDVLRLAVQLCGGDVSLAKTTTFKLNNNERRTIMSLLDQIPNPEEDMLRYKMRWIRLAEVIHTGKYAKKYRNAFAACDKLRNNASSIKTFNSKVEELVAAINTGDDSNAGALLEKLATRPGEFARRLDWMLRTFTAKFSVLVVFSELINKLPVPMLLTLLAHFKYRSTNSFERYFMPKGIMAKIQVITDERGTIDQTTISKITKIITNELMLRFSKLEDLGDVYINKDLSGYLVPLVQRNASKSLVTVARGSHISLMENETARMFLWWKNGDSHSIDVDLSAVFYNSDWNYIDHISYTNLSGAGSVHSGDIQNAPRGASEFIDIDLDKARGFGVRYIVMNVISFSGQPFDSFKCFAGVMGRDKTETGKKFEPKTVKNKFDVTADTKYCIPLIFDLGTNKIIWSDIALKSGRHSNVEGKSDVLIAMSKAVESMVDYKPNMFDLVSLHAEARASSIDYERQEGKEYDTEFDISMASDIDNILANWL